MDSAPNYLFDTDLECRAGNFHMFHDIHNFDRTTGIAAYEANGPRDLSVVCRQYIRGTTRNDSRGLNFRKLLWSRLACHQPVEKQRSLISYSFAVQVNTGQGRN